MDLKTDTSKITKLIDKFNQIQFTISLLNFNEEKFIIKVKEYDECGCKEIVKQEVLEKKEAESIYTKLINDYSLIVKLNNRDIMLAKQIFRNSVNYHEIKPKCCQTCKFSLIEKCKRFPFKHLICLNENNIKTLNETLREYQREDEVAKTFSMIHPEISPFGICINYIESDCEKKQDFFEKEVNDDNDWKKLHKKNHKTPIMETIDIIIK